MYCVLFAPGQTGTLVGVEVAPLWVSVLVLLVDKIDEDDVLVRVLLVLEEDVLVRVLLVLEEDVLVRVLVLEIDDVLVVTDELVEEDEVVDDEKEEVLVVELLLDGLGTAMPGRAALSAFAPYCTSVMAYLR